MKRLLFVGLTGLVTLSAGVVHGATPSPLAVAAPYAAQMIHLQTRTPPSTEKGDVGTRAAKPVFTDTLPQDSAAVLFDQIVLSMLGDPLVDGIDYGIDTTVSPCDDFFLFANGGWRKQVTLPVTKDKTRQMAVFFTYARMRMLQRLGALLDSAREVSATTDDQTLRVLGTFYASCMSADSLEPNYYLLRLPDAHLRDSTRAEQCLQRTISYLGGAAGQAFVQDLQRSGAVTRMEQLLTALRAAVEERLRQNTIMSADEKAYALDRLGKLILRVGIPEKTVDYSSLVLSPTDYPGNKMAIGTFTNTRWVNTIGGAIRERWKASLLTPNAFYMPNDHAIEIPTLMFSPPFFFREGEALLNFAGVGHIIGHEIFHSIAPQLQVIEDSRMQAEIDSFKAFNTSMGTFDGWKAEGKRTFNEDIADLGGSRVAYRAWKMTLAQDSTYTSDTIVGFTPDQRFFLALGRIWRSKWTKAGIHNRAHAPNFARVNAMMMQNPEFKQAFGCQEGDRLYLSDDKLSKIW